jgi:hypothetical protein
MTKEFLVIEFEKERCERMIKESLDFIKSKEGIEFQEKIKNISIYG